MHVKLKNGLCNCAPSKIDCYGKYAWTKGAAERLKNIAKLPDELFEMIKVAPQPTPTATTTTTNAPMIAPATPTTGTPRAARSQGSLLLPLHLPAGQLLHLAPSGHDP